MDPVLKKYISISLNFLSLGLVIAAGSFWAAAGVDSRPKYRDEQTLVGGAVWSQIVIPIGLIISKLAGQELDTFVEGYLMAVGVLLLLSTGLILIIGEGMMLNKQKKLRRLRGEDSALRRMMSSQTVIRPLDYDPIYFSIGILSFIAGLVSLADFIVIVI